jgi:predicted membrane protein
MALALITVGVMAFVDVLSTQVDMAARHYVGAFMAIIGLGLLVGAFVGRARGLIFLGIVGLPVLFISPLSDYDFSTGTQTFHPTTVDEIRPSYRLDGGQLVVDLRDVDFTGETVELDVELGVGEINVLLPQNVAARVTASIGAGEMEILGNRDAGLLRDRRTRQVEGTEGVVVVNAVADIGRIEVQRTGDGPILDDFGSRTITIDTPGELRDDYSIDAGDLTLDLSDMSTMELSTSVSASLDVGTLRVVLPRTTDVEVSASVDIGSIRTPDGERNGIDLNQVYTTDDEAQLFLSLSVGAGEVIVEEAS